MGKSNKFKVNKVSAKIYNKITGIKVSNTKIRDSIISIKDQPSVANNLKDYYKNITDDDRQIAMGSKQCDKKIITLRLSYHQMRMKWQASYHIRT